MNLLCQTVLASVDDPSEKVKPRTGTWKARLTLCSRHLGGQRKKKWYTAVDTRERGPGKGWEENGRGGFGGTGSKTAPSGKNKRGEVTRTIGIPRMQQAL